jgi:hypothetical protein
MVVCREKRDGFSLTSFPVCLGSRRHIFTLPAAPTRFSCPKKSLRVLVSPSCKYNILFICNKAFFRHNLAQMVWDAPQRIKEEEYAIPG